MSKASTAEHPLPLNPVALSFFSGAGGLDIGVGMAGFDVRLVCEIDSICQATLRANLPSTPMLSDITRLDSNTIRKKAGIGDNDPVGLVFGGPPCQAFSTAGRRGGFADCRGNVFLKYLDLAMHINPSVIVIENVRGFLSAQADKGSLPGIHPKRAGRYQTKGGALLYVLDRLKQNGWSYSYNLYNAANFGTPQNRERFVLLATRIRKDVPFLTPTHSETGGHGLGKWESFRGATAGIPVHHHVQFPARRLKYYKLLKAGQNWRNLPISEREAALGGAFKSGGGKTGFYRRLAWDLPSPTLVTCPTMPATDLAHPECDRPLSVEEYKRLQEFPDSWVLAGNILQQYKQIGNAVPCGLARAIGRCAMALIMGKDVPELPDFRYSRYRDTSGKG